MKLLPVIFLLLVASASARGEAVHRVSNAEFKLSVSFPKGLLVCPALAWTHRHGFYAWLDRRDCKNHASGSYIMIRAEYNAASETNLGEILYCKDGDPLSQAAMRELQLQFKGHLSAACRAEHADGRIIVSVVTQAGEQPGTYGSPEDATPEINYTASLRTTRRRFDSDLRVFQAVLRSVRVGDLK